jgi:hypothetical protein
VKTVKSSGESAVSSVIITSVVIILTVATFGYAFYILESSVESSSFEASRGMMMDLAYATINSITSGLKYEFSFPSRYIGLGFYVDNAILRLEVSGIPSPPPPQVIDNSTLTVKCIGSRFASTSYGVIMGVSSPFVDNIYDIPMLTSYWDSDVGGPCISLNFTKILVKTYSFGNNFIIELTYIDVSWTPTGGSASNMLTVNYAGTVRNDIYKKNIGSTDAQVRIKLYLDNRLLGDKSIFVPKLSDLTIRLVIHKVNYVWG